ncbi:hypothetical protein RAC89_15825 [Paenibacillus sp. GD4]|uniref:anti-sigma factor n=1 Tax=Paenibacillus sp. GD4 TaxID=3068890 RepID=UPI002796C875|nr:zf-HC2 domain-containing protein [Paenibacillus sp. GD4]MDQ1911873.1 hypothetical protein [Paenibacillus sp. GD4]
MSIMHPDDQELQRYLNRSCTELEAKRTSRHLKQCPRCRKRLTDYADLEAELSELPLITAPDRLTERIMHQIHAKPWEREDSTMELPPSPTGRWRPELMNGLIATAATFFLILTGIPGKLMQLSPSQLESSVEATVAQLTQFVEIFSRGMLT